MIAENDLSMETRSVNQKQTAIRSDRRVLRNEDILKNGDAVDSSNTPLFIRYETAHRGPRSPVHHHWRKWRRRRHAKMNEAALARHQWRPTWGESLLRSDAVIPIKDDYSADIDRDDEDFALLLRQKQSVDTLCIILRKYVEDENSSLMAHLPKYMKRAAISGRFYVDPKTDILCFREGSPRRPGISDASCDEDFDSSPGTLRVAPASLRASILKLAHEAPVHHGSPSTLNRVRRRYGFWWPHMRDHIKAHCMACNTCQHIKKGVFKNYRRTGKLVQFSATVPFEQISVDLVGPLPICDDRSGAQYIVTMIDRFSRYCMLIPTRDVTAFSVIKALDRWVTTFGPPRSILSDNGPQFVSGLYSDFMTQHGVELRFTTTYNPRCNGQIERLHRWIKERLRCVAYDGGLNFVDGVDDWADYLPIIQYAYNTTPNRMTSYSPMKLIFGGDRKSFFEYQFDDTLPGEYVDWLRKRQRILWRSAAAVQSKYDAQRLRSFSKGKHAAPIEVGSQVLWDINAQFVGNESKFGPRWIGPYEVVESFNDGQSFTVRLPSLDDVAVDAQFMNSPKIPRRGRMIEAEVDDKGQTLEPFTVPRSQLKPFFESFEDRHSGIAVPTNVALRFLKEQIAEKRCAALQTVERTVERERNVTYRLPATLRLSDFTSKALETMSTGVSHSSAPRPVSCTQRLYHSVFLLQETRLFCRQKTRRRRA